MVGLHDGGFGLNLESLTVWQIVARAVVIYLAGVLLVRVGDRRFLGKSAAFDVIFGVILGQFSAGRLPPRYRCSGL
jgi:hypothetical protein